MSDLDLGQEAWSLWRESSCANLNVRYVAHHRHLSIKTKAMTIEIHEKYTRGEHPLMQTADLSLSCYRPFVSRLINSSIVYYHHDNPNAKARFTCHRVKSECGSSASRGFIFCLLLLPSIPRYCTNAIGLRAPSSCK